MSARQPDHLRHPFPRRHQRFNPFDRGGRRALATTCALLAQGVEARCNASTTALSSDDRMLRASPTRPKSSHTSPSASGASERSCGGGARPVSQRVGQVCESDRAHRVLRLGEDEVGLERAQQFRIDGIDQLPLPDHFLDTIVNLPRSEGVGCSSSLGHTISGRCSMIKWRHLSLAAASSATRLETANRHFPARRYGRTMRKS